MSAGNENKSQRAGALGAACAIVFDDSCSFCRRQVAWIERSARAGTFELVPRSSPDLLARFPQLASADLNTGLRLIPADGRVFVGADGVYEIARRMPVPRLFAWLYLVPGLRQVFRAAYGWVAANRDRLAGKCGADKCASGQCDAAKRG